MRKRKPCMAGRAVQWSTKYVVHRSMTRILALIKNCLHTSQSSFYKWTKISSLESTIFYSKMMVKSGLDFLLWDSPSPFRVASSQCKNICSEWQLAWQLSRYLFFKKNSIPLFTIIFKIKNDHFKTRDFSPLIERVLAGVIFKPTSKVSLWSLGPFYDFDVLIWCYLTFPWIR